MKLGELLVKAGRITPEELDEALNSQVFFGGKLGTNLIEMGCIDEKDIVRILSKITGIPPVQPEQLEHVPPDVIKMVTTEMAERYRIIPVAVEKKRLQLAMADPTDLPAIDEISFATGLIIIPLIASEPMISRYLHIYYGITQNENALRLPGDGRRRRRTEQESERTEDGDATLFPEDVEAFSPLELEVKEFEGHLYESDDTTEGSSEEVNGGIKQSPTLADVYSERLVLAQNRDEIAATLLEFVAMYYEKAALLVVKKGVLAGWCAMVAGRELLGFSEITLPMEASPVISYVVESRTRYEGSIPDAIGDRRIVECLGGSTDPVSIVPITLQNRAVAMLYLTGRCEDTALPEIIKFASKAAMALEILILKNKILMT